MSLEAFIVGLDWGVWNYIIMFFVAFLESIPFIGLIIPGQTLVAIAGFAAHAHVFQLHILIITLALAAMIGDGLSYILGRRYGLAFLRKWGKYFLFKEEYITKTEKIIRSHLGKSLIIGRMHSLTRCFAPFLAGVHRAPLPQFILYTILGGALWAMVFVYIGYFIGESFRYFERY